MGILVWQALAYSVVLAAALAGVALWLPTWPGTESLAHFLDSCVAMLRQQYATPGGAVTATGGGLLALGVTARTGVALVARSIRVAGGRATQRRHLELLARRELAPGVLVVEHHRPAAYCLPGRRRAVVVTSAAVACLTSGELAAVLAHERAHLRGRHDLMVASTDALTDAFGFLPVFGAATSEIARLIELRADDVALRGTERLTLARALVRLAETAAPAGALSAGGATAVQRVRRLARPPGELGALRSAVLIGASALLLAVPLAIISLPALVVASSAYCPLPMA